MDAPTEQIRRLAEMITASIGRTSISRPENFFKAFDKIIDYMALGSFVIVGRALERFLDIDFEKTMLKSREYIIKGDKWYVCDII